MMRGHLLRAVLTGALLLVATTLGPQVGASPQVADEYQASVAMCADTSMVVAAVLEVAWEPGEWIDLSALPPQAVAAAYYSAAALCALADMPFEPSDLEGASVAVTWSPSGVSSESVMWQLTIVNWSGDRTFFWSYQYEP